MLTKNIKKSFKKYISPSYIFFLLSTSNTDFLSILSLDCYFRVPLEVTTGFKVVSPEANTVTPSIIQEKCLKNLPSAPTNLGFQRDQEIRHDDGKVIVLKC